MRWLADECVTVSLVRELRGAGHDVIYIAEFAASLSDVEVIALALREGRLLLTADKDFGVSSRPSRTGPGLAAYRSGERAAGADAAFGCRRPVRSEPLRPLCRDRRGPFANPSLVSYRNLRT